MSTQADRHAERTGTLPVLGQRQKNSSRCIAVGADKAYDVE
jgi:hypothetical protein